MKNSLLVGVICGVVMLSGCVSKQSDSSLSVSRTIPERMTDVGIEREILRGLDNVAGLSQTNHRVAIDAFQGEVLLTGEVPNELARSSIENMAKSIREVRQVHNRLVVADEPKSQSHTVHENYLKTKYITKILAGKNGIKPTQYHAVVRSDILYLMGTLTPTQAELAHQTAKQTEGIIGFTSLAKVFGTSQDLKNYNSSTIANLPYGQLSGYTAPSLPQTVTNPPNTPNPPVATPQSGTTGSSYIDLYRNTNNP